MPENLREIFSEITAKKDIYDYMKLHLCYYLIGYENFTKGKQLLIIVLILILDYLKEIFNNKKELLKQSDVKTIDVIKYDELSVMNLYDKFMTLDGL